MSILQRLAKVILPNRPVGCRILSGPFQGTRIRLNPRHSLRKIFGLYEHELNGWIHAVLPRVKVLYDVGANDGYFLFGCLNWFKRHQIAAQIFGFEPDAKAFQSLADSAQNYRDSGVTVQLMEKFVGEATSDRTVSLDGFVSGIGEPHPTTGALVKIDVEGAERSVLRGAETLLHAGNFFLVEVHSTELLESLTTLFHERGLPMQLVVQRPLPFLGRERRSADNWWLVSQLDAVRIGH